MYLFWAIFMNHYFRINLSEAILMKKIILNQIYESQFSESTLVNQNVELIYLKQNFWAKVLNQICEPKFSESKFLNQNFKNFKKFQKISKFFKIFQKFSKFWFRNCYSDFLVQKLLLRFFGSEIIIQIFWFRSVCSDFLPQKLLLRLCSSEILIQESLLRF